MFEYYVIGNKNYTADGNVTLKPSKSKLKIELNGICEIEMEHPYDKEGRWKLITEDGVIKAPTPWSDGQLFVIYNLENTMSSIKISAYHIFFDLNYSRIDDKRAVNKTGQEALDIILSGTKYIGHSNISSINTSYWVKEYRVAAINGDNDNSFINRWGGEIFLNNFHVFVNYRIGGDYGAFVNYGINMLDLGLKRDMTGVITRVRPKAYNGIELPEKYVDSPLINKYRIEREGDLDCSDLKLKNDCNEDEKGYETEEELYKAMRERVKEAFNKGLDKPTVSGTTKVAPLENTTKYKYVKGLVSIGLGDTVSVNHEDIGVVSETRCVGYTWNQISKKFEEVTLGELEKNFFNESSDAKTKLDNILNKDGTVDATSINGVINALSTKFKAQRDIAQPQQVRAMIFEDRVEGSETYGAMCIGSMGFEIASKRTADDKDWDWRTFGTGSGFTADFMNTGTLSSILIKALKNSGSNMYIDLSDGNVYMDKGKIGSDSFYIDISNQKIIGKDMEINLVTGEIKTKHGKFGNDTCYYDVDNQIIYGLKTLLKLAEGIYSFADGNVVIDNEKGIEIKKGKVGNDTCYFDIGNQIIRGDRFYIDLKSGGQNLIEAGNISSQNGRTNICMTDGTAKIGSFSVSHDNKVNVEDGSFTAKSGDKYCKMESGQVSWNDGSRIINNNKHIISTVTQTREIESLDIIGNTNGGVTLSSKAANALVNANSDSVYISFNKKNEFYADDVTWIAGNPNGIHASGSIPLNTLFLHSGTIEADGNFKVTGDKNCVQKTKSFGDVKFSSLEDIGSYLTWREYNSFKEDYIYETKLKSYSKDGYCSCIVKIPEIIQECIDTEGNYDVYINVVKSFANARLWNIRKTYFLVKSDKPCRFNFVLTGRRKGFEKRSLEEQILQGEIYKTNKYNELLRCKSAIKLRFKKLGLRPNYPLWKQCSEDWIKYGLCFEG